MQCLYNVPSEPNVQVKRYKLDEVLLKGTVEQIIPVMDKRTVRIMRQRAEDEAMTVTESTSEDSKKKVEYFQVKLRDGTNLKASQVVVATGPTRAQMANIPSWVKSIGENFPEERLRHTVQLMHYRPTAQHVAADLACEGQKDAKGKLDFYLNMKFSNNPNPNSYLWLCLFRVVCGARGRAEGDGSWWRPDQRPCHLTCPESRCQSCDLGHEEAPAGLVTVFMNRNHHFLFFLMLSTSSTPLHIFHS